MGEIQKRFETEARQKQEQKQKEEDKKKQELKDFIASNVKLANFRQKHYPIFKKLLYDFAEEIDRFIDEDPPYSCVARYSLSEKVKKGFLGSFFPQKGSAWKFSFGAISQNYFGGIDGVDSVTFFVSHKKDTLKKKLEEVPEDIEEAKEWFNAFLFECYKLGIKKIYMER